jgi:hypothetical protein
MGGKQGKSKSTKKNSAELSEEEIKLLLNNTHFNRKQIEEWHSGFIVSALVKFRNFLKDLLRISHRKKKKKSKYV